MKHLIDFIKETWHRFGLPSPTFFQVVQWISGAIAFVTGLPQLLLKYQAEFHITFPHWIFTFSDQAAANAAFIALIIASLPVKNPNALKIKDGNPKPLLPFTSNTN